MLRKINITLDALRLLNHQTKCLTWCRVRELTTSKALTTSEKPSTNVSEVQSKNALSKAMKAYLERAREHDEFMKKQRYEYEIGKRHLANMMGENPDTFTQEDVNNAIEYLFPSGLFEKKARPLMKPPEEVFPQRKAAEFDESGRPFHFLFYTGRPNYYQVLYDSVQKINELNKFEDSMIRKGLKPDPNLKLELSGYQWLEKEFLEIKLVEPLTDRDYNEFINVMERLASLPYSYREKDFITQYRKPLMNPSKTQDAPQPQIGEDGKQFVTVYECKRKLAKANVTVKMPGTGEITINGKDITYFKEIQSRNR